MTSLVYWRWQYNGSLSHLHRTHPTHTRFTWCGAVAVEGRAGVGQLFHLASYPRGVELCEACATMKQPIRLNVKADKAEAA